VHIQVSLLDIYLNSFKIKCFFLHRSCNHHFNNSKTYEKFRKNQNNKHRGVSSWLIDFEELWKHILIVRKYISRKYFYFLVFHFLNESVKTTFVNKILHFLKSLILFWKMMFGQICWGNWKLRNKKFSRDIPAYYQNIHPMFLKINQPYKLWP
jgi:hypothetical protein